jgi:hypothetical protein
LRSPTRLLREDAAFGRQTVVARVPRVFLFHGSADTCVFDSVSRDLDAALRQRGVRSSCKIYHGPARVSLASPPPHLAAP